MSKRGGWFKESYRHYLAAKGVSTVRSKKRYMAAVGRPPIWVRGVAPRRQPDTLLGSFLRDYYLTADESIDRRAAASAREKEREKFLRSAYNLRPDEPIMGDYGVHSQFSEDELARLKSFEGQLGKDIKESVVKSKDTDILAVQSVIDQTQDAMNAAYSESARLAELSRQKVLQGKSVSPDQASAYADEANELLERSKALANAAVQAEADLGYQLTLKGRLQSDESLRADQRRKLYEFRNKYFGSVAKKEEALEQAEMGAVRGIRAAEKAWSHTDLDEALKSGRMTQEEVAHYKKETGMSPQASAPKKSLLGDVPMAAEPKKETVYKDKDVELQMK